jgi:quercetin dioxygenase-like cupin family protein
MEERSLRPLGLRIKDFASNLERQRSSSEAAFQPQSDPRTEVIIMEPIHLFEKAEFSKENFIPKQLHIGDAGAAVLICFEPGQTMPLHPHPGALEVILYGVEGEGTLAIGDEEKPFKKGDLVFCKGEIPIGPKNTGQGKFMVLVILVLKQLVSKTG